MVCITKPSYSCSYSYNPIKRSSPLHTLHSTSAMENSGISIVVFGKLILPSILLDNPSFPSLCTAKV
jgi:hypothetical protein